MSVLRRILGLGERRAVAGGLGVLDGDWTATGFSLSTAGTKVNIDTAMRVATFYACVKIISEDLASLPMELMETYGNGKIRPAVSDPDYETIRSGISDDTPNYVFWQAFFQSALMTGMGYAGIRRHPGNQTLDSMFPIHPAWVHPMRRIPPPGAAPDFGEGVAYQVRVPNFDPVYLFPGDTIMPMAVMSRNGITGASPIADQCDTIGLALAQDVYASNLMVNQARPSGVLTTEHSLDDEQYEEAKKQWAVMQSGPQNAGKTVILPYNLKWQPTTISPQNVEYMDQRKMTREEICAVHRVPPHMVGIMDHATFSNIEQQALNYITNTLRPWCVFGEQTFNRYGLRKSQRDAGKFVKFNLDDLERGDRESRFTSYNTGVLTGVLTRNECRRMEGLNPMPGADTLLVPLNMGIQTAAPIPLQPSSAPQQQDPAAAKGKNPPGQQPAGKTPKPTNKNADPLTEAQQRLIMNYTLEEDPAGLEQERIKRAFRALAEDAFHRIVRREVQAVSKSVRKFNLKQLSDWWPEFSSDMRTFYAAQLNPVLLRAASALCELTPAQKDLIEDAVKRGAERYMLDSLNELRLTFERDTRAEAFEVNLTATLAGWSVRKAEEWAIDETDTIFGIVEN